MQTFLPYASFKQSAQVLDNKRLGKQRVEAYQVIRALCGESKGWVNHPATVMWRGYENYLCKYGAVMCTEWMQRGFKDSLFAQFIDYYQFFEEIKPWWYDYEPLHISHQSNLYRKDPVHYAMFADAPKDLPYVWCETPNTYHLGTNREVVYI
jgi:hypothetical protein